MENNNISVTETELKFNYFKTFRRIALVIFLGFSVFLVVSTIMLIFLTKSAKEIKVPNVIGKRFIDVHNSLVRNGLKPDIKFKDINNLDQGIILGQYPESGTIVNEDSRIKLVVNRSKIDIEVPNLVGIELPVVKNKLMNLHSRGKSISLSTGIISYISSIKNAENIVINQNPKPGKIISPDVKINLLVSIGAKKTGNKMPDVMNQSIDLSYDLLQSKELIVKENIIETADIKKTGIIASQSIRPGKLLKKNDAVNLKIYWFKIKNHPYLAYEIVDFKIPQNEKTGLYEVLIEDNFSKRVRFAANMNPGNRIKFIFQRVGNAKISVLRDKTSISVMSIKVEEFQ